LNPDSDWVVCTPSFRTRKNIFDIFVKRLAKNRMNVDELKTLTQKCLRRFNESNRRLSKSAKRIADEILAHTNGNETVLHGVTEQQVRDAFQTNTATGEQQDTLRFRVNWYLQENIRITTPLKRPKVATLTKGQRALTQDVMKMSFVRFPSDLRLAFSGGKFGKLAQHVSAEGALRDAKTLVSSANVNTTVKRVEPLPSVVSQYSTPPSQNYGAAADAAAARALITQVLQDKPGVLASFVKQLGSELNLAI